MLRNRGIAAASPEAVSRPIASMPTSPGLARIQACERSTRTGAVGAVGVSPHPTATRSAPSAKTVRRGTSVATLRLLRQLARRQGNGGFRLAVDHDLEAVRPRVRQRHVEHQYRARLDVGDARGRLREVHGAVAAQDLGVLLVQQLDLYLVLSYLRALALEAQHQMEARVHRGKLLHPDVLEDAEYGELARLIHERVVGDHGEVEVHATSARTGSTRGSAPTRASGCRLNPAGRWRW